MGILWRILATLTLVALNGYFVAAEFAAVGARLSRLEAEEKKSLLTRMCLDIKRRLDLYLSSCQLGVTLASLGLGAVTEPAVAGVLLPLLEWLRVPTTHVYVISFVAALAVSTTLHIIIGEQAPKNWAIRFADRVLPVIAPPLVLFTYVFYPFIWALNQATRAVLRMTGVEVDLGGEGTMPHSEEELRALVSQAVASGTIAKGKGRLLASAFDFGELKVRQIMTPRTSVDYLTLGQPLGEMLKIVQSSAYTRLPLCDGDIDHVIGLVHMKDLFNHLKLIPGKLKFLDERAPGGETVAVPTGLPGSAVHVIGSGEIDLQAIRRDVLFVPELLPVPRLLRQFQQSHIHLAVVVDEYGATQGIVTLEDVLEEIVGEIEDEFDPIPPADFVREGESIKVSGSYPLHELRDRIALDDVEAEGVDTVGGYIVQQLNRWPRPGDLVPLGDFHAKVLSVQQKRVGQVLITPKKPAEVKAAGNGHRADGP